MDDAPGRKSSKIIFAIHDPWMKGYPMGDVDDIVAMFAEAELYESVTIFIVNDIPGRCEKFKNLIGRIPPNCKIICDDDPELEDSFRLSDEIFWFAPITEHDPNLHQLMLDESEKRQKRIYMQGDEANGYNFKASTHAIKDALRGKCQIIVSNQSNRFLTGAQLDKVIPEANKHLIPLIFKYNIIRLICLPEASGESTWNAKLPQRLYTEATGCLGNNLKGILRLLQIDLPFGVNASQVACNHFLETAAETPPDYEAALQSEEFKRLMRANPSVTNYLNFTGNPFANAALAGVPIVAWPVPPNEPLGQKLQIGLALAAKLAEKFGISYAGELPPDKSVDYSDEMKVPTDLTSPMWDFSAVLMIRNGELIQDASRANQPMEEAYFNMFLQPKDPNSVRDRSPGRGGGRSRNYRFQRSRRTRRGGRRRSSRNRHKSSKTRYRRYR